MGAILDSIADIFVNLITVVGLWVFQKETVIAHRRGCVDCAGTYIWRMIAFATSCDTEEPSSFHTVLIRIAAYAQGAFILSLFFWGFIRPFYYAAASLCILAVVEELVLVFLISGVGRPDVGGLYWVISKRRASPQ